MGRNRKRAVTSADKHMITTNDESKNEAKACFCGGSLLLK
jgi:hypothetical protein